MRIDVGMVGTVIARGDAEIGFQQLSELRDDMEKPLKFRNQQLSTQATTRSVRTSAPDLGRDTGKPYLND